MLQQTIDRVKDFHPPIIVGQEMHRFLVQEQLQESGVDKFDLILEPVGRNTAPAIALAAWQALKYDGDAQLLVMPADHLIIDTDGFLAKVNFAQSVAEKDYLLTFGIKPQYAETGYGYIQAGSVIEKGCFQVSQFVEKPDENTATMYLNTGEYYWNSGMFLFKASVYLEALKQHQPQIYAHIEQAFSTHTLDNHFIRPESSAFASCEDLSIDYAIMEKTDKAAVVPADIGWSDIGSWKSLWQASAKDQCNNVIQGDVITEQSMNCHIQADHRLVAAVGTQNLVIVETADAVMVADKSAVQNVKLLVDQLKLDERPETSLHRKVYRPWGTYEGVDISDKFQVKRISVKPGAKLSLQKHQHRSEHWIVVSGIARVTCDEKVFDLLENQSTYIPCGSVHRLENQQDEWLELIEVQTGDYFGEDDIVRLEDVYDRKPTE